MIIHSSGPLEKETQLKRRKDIGHIEETPDNVAIPQANNQVPNLDELFGVLPPEGQAREKPTRSRREAELAQRRQEAQQRLANLEGQLKQAAIDAAPRPGVYSLVYPIALFNELIYSKRKSTRREGVNVNWIKMSCPIIQ